MTKVLLNPKSPYVLGEVSAPGSKSMTNRALILAAQQPNPVVLHNALACDDTAAMCACLRSVGLTIDEIGEALHISGKSAPAPTCTLHARLSGTTLRFLVSYALTLPCAHVTLTGDEGLCKRPIGDLVDALRAAGAHIRYTNRDGFPPLEITPAPITAKRVRIKGGTSSQFISSILLSAHSLGIESLEVCDGMVSRSYLDLTIEMLRVWGMSVDYRDHIFFIQKKSRSALIHEYNIEGDYSAAGYFFALAVLLKKSITVRNLNPRSLQGDRQFVSILASMGNVVEWKPNAVTIHGTSLKPLRVPMEQCPDQAQTLAVLLAFADGTSVLTGVRTLRVKETERVRAIQTELKKMGIATESPDTDTLIIHGGRPRPASIETYGDHRMAMSFAIAGSVLKGMTIQNAQVVSKTVPLFWELLESTGSVEIAYEHT